MLESRPARMEVFSPGGSRLLLEQGPCVFSEGPRRTWAGFSGVDSDFLCPMSVVFLFHRLVTAYVGDLLYGKAMPALPGFAALDHLTLSLPTAQDFHERIASMLRCLQDGMPQNLIQLNSVINSLGRGRSQCIARIPKPCRASAGQSWEEATHVAGTMARGSLGIRPDAVTMQGHIAACGQGPKKESSSPPVREQPEPRYTLTSHWAVGQPRLVSKARTYSGSSQRRSLHEMPTQEGSACLDLSRTEIVASEVPV